MQGLVNFTTAIADGIAVLLPAFCYLMACGCFFFFAWTLWTWSEPHSRYSHPHHHRPVDSLDIIAAVRRFRELPAFSDDGQCQLRHQSDDRLDAIRAHRAAEREQHPRFDRRTPPSSTSSRCFSTSFRRSAPLACSGRSCAGAVSSTAACRVRRPLAASSSCSACAASTSSRSPTASSSSSRPAADSFRTSRHPFALSRGTLARGAVPSATGVQIGDFSSRRQASAEGALLSSHRTSSFRRLLAAISLGLSGALAAIAQAFAQTTTGGATSPSGGLGAQLNLDVGRGDQRGRHRVRHGVLPRRGGLLRPRRLGALAEPSATELARPAMSAAASPVWCCAACSPPRGYGSARPR